MARWQGFSDRLQTPGDLFQKLEHDFERLRRDSSDPYAAFDFFVTGECVVDWLYPDDGPAQKELRSAEPFKTVAHLANGAKHFAATRNNPDSVANVRQQPGFLQAGAFDPEVFYVGGVVIDRQTGESVRVIALAREVLEGPVLP